VIDRDSDYHVVLLSHESKAVVLANEDGDVLDCTRHFALDASGFCGKSIFALKLLSETSIPVMSSNKKVQT
jgi:hypothetical protein